MNSYTRDRRGSARRRTLPPWALGLVVVLAALAILAADASASGTLPVSPINLGSAAAHDGLQVRPAEIVYTGDGTGFLGGANVRDRNDRIQWTKWTTSIALGTGFDQLNNCEPSCAGGTYHGFKVKIEMWRPRTLAGTLVFTRMTIFYKSRRPSGEPTHYTFTDTYQRRLGYGWGPPDAQGYCVNTYGEPPAAGCQNVHSLP